MGLLDEFYAPDYSKLKRGQFRQDTPKMREYAANVPVDLGRGTVAGLLGLLSDTLNFAPAYSPTPMEQFGEFNYAPSQKVPFGSEEFLKTLPLAPAADNPVGRVAGQIGTFAPMVPVQAARLASRGAMAVGRAGERYAEKVVPQIMERGGLGAEMLGAMSNRTISPLDVYHGSPHRLPPTERNPLGEFDASKIGTGEGAQVYGHGIYTAEAPSVAQGYKDTLAYKAFDVAPEAEKLGLKLSAGTRGEFIRQAAVNKSPEAKARSLQNANIAARDLPKEKLAELFKEYEDRGGGNLYKVDLPDEMIPKMLDYDKHLSEQSPEVQKILFPYQKEIGSSFGTGEQTLKAIAFERRMKGLDDSPAAVAEQLRQMGIPGVKYLDQQSRNAGGWHLTSPDNTVRGKWMLKSSDYNSNGVFFDSQKEAEAALKEKLGKETRNFVTFPGEEKNLRILERNGLLY